MSSLLKYMKQEGLSATAKKAWNKAFRKGDSRTVFLRATLSDEIKMNNERMFEIMDESNRAAFEEIKFWDFVKADDYIGNEHQSVVLLRDGDRYIAYAAEEHELNRVIHGTGLFKLGPGQGWIGPVYVSRQWRGKGYNRQLLQIQMYRLNKMGIKTIYTAINSQNDASLKSFKRAGFAEIGTLDAQGNILTDTDNILHAAFSKVEEK